MACDGGTIYLLPLITLMVIIAAPAFASAAQINVIGCLSNVLNYTSTAVGSPVQSLLLTSSSQPLTSEYIDVDANASIRSCSFVQLRASKQISVAPSAIFINSVVTLLGASIESTVTVAGNWQQRSNVSIGGTIGVLVMNTNTAALSLDRGSVISVAQSTVVYTCAGEASLQLRHVEGPWLDLTAANVTMMECDLTVVDLLPSSASPSLPAVWFGNLGNQQPYFCNHFNLTLRNVSYAAIGGRWGTNSTIRFAGVSVALSTNAQMSVNASRGTFGVSFDSLFECHQCTLSFPQAPSGMLVVGLFNHSIVSVKGAAQPTIAGQWIAGSVLTMTECASPITMSSSLLMANVSQLSIISSVTPLCDSTLAGCAMEFDIIRGTFLSGAAATFTGLTNTMLSDVVVGEGASVAVTERNDLSTVVRASSMRLVRVLVQQGGGLSITSASGVTKLTVCGVQFEGGSPISTKKSSLNLTFRGLLFANVLSFVSSVVSTANATTVRLAVVELDAAPASCPVAYAANNAFTLSYVASLPWAQTVLILNRCFDVVLMRNTSLSAAVIVIAAGSIVVNGSTWYNSSSVTLVSVERSVVLAATLSFSASSLTIASSAASSCGVGIVLQGAFYNSSLLVANDGIQQLIITNCTMVRTSMDVVLDQYPTALAVIGPPLSYAYCNETKYFTVASSVTIRGASQRLSYTCTSALCSVPPNFTPNLDLLNPVESRTLTAKVLIGGGSFLQFAQAELYDCCGWSSVAVSVVGKSPNSDSTEVISRPFSGAPWSAKELVFIALRSSIILQYIDAHLVGVSMVLSTIGTVSFDRVSLYSVLISIVAPQGYLQGTVTMQGSTRITVDHSGIGANDRIVGGSISDSASLVIQNSAGTLAVKSFSLADFGVLSVSSITFADWDSSFTVGDHSTLSVTAPPYVSYTLSFSSCFLVASNSDVSVAFSAFSLVNVEYYLLTSCGFSLGGLSLTSAKPAACPSQTLASLRTSATRRLKLDYNGCADNYLLADFNNWNVEMVGFDGSAVNLHGTMVNSNIAVQCGILYFAYWAALSITGGKLSITAPVVYTYYAATLVGVGISFGSGTSFNNEGGLPVKLSSMCSFTYNGRIGANIGITGAAPFMWSDPGNALFFTAYDASQIISLFGTKSLTTASLNVTSSVGATALSWTFCTGCNSAFATISISSPVTLSIIGGGFRSLSLTATATVSFMSSTLSTGTTLQVFTSGAFLAPSLSTLQPGAVLQVDAGAVPTLGTLLSCPQLGAQSSVSIRSLAQSSTVTILSCGSVVSGSSVVLYLPQTSLVVPLMQLYNSSFVIAASTSVSLGPGTIAGSTQVRITASGQVTLPTSMSLSTASSMLLYGSSITLTSGGGAFSPAMYDGSSLLLAPIASGGPQMSFPIQISGASFTGASNLSIGFSTSADVSMVGSFFGGSVVLSTIMGTLLLQGNYSNNTIVRVTYARRCQLSPWTSSSLFYGMAWSSSSALEVLAADLVLVGGGGLGSVMKVVVQGNSIVSLLTEAAISLSSVVSLVAFDRGVLRASFNSLVMAQLSQVPVLQVVSVAQSCTIVLRLPQSVTVSIGRVDDRSSAVVSFQGPLTARWQGVVYFSLRGVISNNSTVSIVNASTVGLRRRVGPRTLSGSFSSTVTFASLSKEQSSTRTVSLPKKRRHTKTDAASVTPTQTGAKSKSITSTLSSPVSPSESLSNEATGSFTPFSSTMAATATPLYSASPQESITNTSLLSQTPSASRQLSASRSVTRGPSTSVLPSTSTTLSVTGEPSSTRSRSLSLVPGAVRQRSSGNALVLREADLVVTGNSNVIIVGAAMQPTLTDVVSLLGRTAVVNSSVLSVTVSLLNSSATAALRRTLTPPLLSNNATVTIEFIANVGSAVSWPRIDLGGSLQERSAWTEAPSSLTIIARGSVAYLAANFTNVALGSLRLSVLALSFSDVAPASMFAWLRGTAVNVTVGAASTKAFAEILSSTQGSNVSIATLSSTCALGGECSAVTVAASTLIPNPFSSLSLTVPLSVGVHLQFPQPFVNIFVAAAAVTLGGTISNFTRVVVSSTAGVSAPIGLRLGALTSLILAVPCAANASQLLSPQVVSIDGGQSCNISIQSTWCPLLGPVPLAPSIVVKMTANFSAVAIVAPNESLWVNLTEIPYGTALNLSARSVTLVGASADAPLSVAATTSMSEGGGLHLGAVDRLWSSRVNFGTATATEWTTMLTDVQGILAASSHIILTTSSRTVQSNIVIDLHGSFQNASISFDMSDSLTANVSFEVTGQLDDIWLALQNVRAGRLRFLASAIVKRSVITCTSPCNLIDFEVAGTFEDTVIVVASIAIPSASTFDSLRPTRFDHSELTIGELGFLNNGSSSSCSAVVNGVFSNQSNVTLSVGAAGAAVRIILSTSSAFVGGSSFSLSPIRRLSLAPTYYRVLLQGVVASSFVSYVSSYVDALSSCPSDALTTSSVATAPTCVVNGSSRFDFSGLYWVANTNQRSTPMFESGRANAACALRIANSSFAVEVTTIVNSSVLLQSGLFSSNWSTVFLENVTMVVSLPPKGFGTSDWTAAGVSEYALIGIFSQAAGNTTANLLNVRVSLTGVAAARPTPFVSSGHVVVVSVEGNGVAMPATVSTSLNMTNVTIESYSVDFALTVLRATNVGKRAALSSASSSGGLWVALSSCAWYVTNISRFRGLEASRCVLRQGPIMLQSNMSLPSSQQGAAILFSNTTVVANTSQYDNYAMLIHACNSSDGNASGQVALEGGQILLSATAVIDTSWNSQYTLAQWISAYGLAESRVQRLPVACGCSLLSTNNLTIETRANVEVRRTLVLSNGTVVSTSVIVSPKVSRNTGGSIVYVGGRVQGIVLLFYGTLTSTTDMVALDCDALVESVVFFGGAQLRVLAPQTVAIVSTSGGASGIRETLSMTSVTATCSSVISSFSSSNLLPRRIDLSECNIYGLNSLIAAEPVATASMKANIAKSRVTCASRASSLFAMTSLSAAVQVEVVLDGTYFVHCGQISSLSSVGASSVSFYLRCVPWDSPLNYLMPKQAAPYFSPFVSSAVQFAGNSGNVTCVTSTLEPTLSLPSATLSASPAPSATRSQTASISMTASPSISSTESTSGSSTFSRSWTLTVSRSGTLSHSTTLTESSTSSDSNSVSSSVSMSRSPSFTTSTTSTASESYTASLSVTLSRTVSLSLSVTGSTTLSQFKSASRVITKSRSASPSASSSWSHSTTITHSLTVSIDPCNTTFRSTPTAFLASIDVTHPADGPGTLNMTDAIFYTIDRVSFAAAEYIDIAVVFNTQLRNMYGVTSESWFPLPDVTDNCISGGYRLVNDTSFVMTLTYDSGVSLRVRKVTPYYCNVTFSTDVFQCQLMTNFSFNFSLAMYVTGTPENVSPIAELVLKWIGLVGNFAQGPAVLQQSRFQVLATLADCQFSLVDELDVATHPLSFGFGSDLGYYLRGCVVGNIVFVMGLALLLLAVLAVYASITALRQKRPFRDKFLYLLGRAGFPGVLIVPIGLTFDGLVSSSVTIIVHPTDQYDKLIGGCGLAFSLLIVGSVAAVAIQVDGCLQRRRAAVAVKLPMTHPLSRRRSDRTLSSTVRVRMKRLLRKWLIGVRYEELEHNEREPRPEQAGNVVVSQDVDQQVCDPLPVTESSLLEPLPDDAPPLEPSLNTGPALSLDLIIDGEESSVTASLLAGNEEGEIGLNWLLHQSMHPDDEADRRGDLLECPLQEVTSSSSDDVSVNIDDAHNAPATILPPPKQEVFEGLSREPKVPASNEEVADVTTIWSKMFEPIMENRVALFVVVELIVSMVNAVVVGIAISERPLCYKLSIISCVSYCVYFVALVVVRPSATRLLMATNIILAFLNFDAALLIVCSMAMSRTSLGEVAQQISFGASVLAMAQIVPSTMAIISTSRKFWLKWVRGFEICSEDDEFVKVEEPPVIVEVEQVPVVPSDEELVRLKNEENEQFLRETVFSSMLKRTLQVQDPSDKGTTSLLMQMFELPSVAHDAENTDDLEMVPTNFDWTNDIAAEYSSHDFKSRSNSIASGVPRMPPPMLSPLLQLESLDAEPLAVSADEDTLQALIDSMGK